MSAHLSRLRLFQRHLRSLVWAWVWVWDWIPSHNPPRTRSPSSRHPPFTHYPFPPRSLVCGGQASPHKPRLVVSHSTCPPLSSSPHAHSFVLGTAVLNTHNCLEAGLLERAAGGPPTDGVRSGAADVRRRQPAKIVRRASGRREVAAVVAKIARTMGLCVEEEKDLWSWAKIALWLQEHCNH
jgi:hypothetical protein